MNAQEVPEGTVTVPFTDLVESTQLNQSVGDDAARQIGRRVEEMARQTVASNRGALPRSWAAHRFQDVINSAVDA